MPSILALSLAYIPMFISLNIMCFQLLADGGEEESMSAVVLHSAGFVSIQISVLSTFLWNQRAGASSLSDGHVAKSHDKMVRRHLLRRDSE